MACTSCGGIERLYSTIVSHTSASITSYFGHALALAISAILKHSNHGNKKLLYGCHVYFTMYLTNFSTKILVKLYQSDGVCEHEYRISAKLNSVELNFSQIPIQSTQPNYSQNFKFSAMVVRYVVYIHTSVMHEY